MPVAKDFNFDERFDGEFFLDCPACERCGEPLSLTWDSVANYCDRCIAEIEDGEE